MTDVLKEQVHGVADPVKALLEGKVQTVEFSNGNVVIDAPRSGRVYMAGSFNPLHDGHRGMLAAALKARQDQQGQFSLPLVLRFRFHLQVLVVTNYRCLQDILHPGLLPRLCLHCHFHKCQLC